MASRGGIGVRTLESRTLLNGALVVDGALVRWADDWSIEPCCGVVLAAQRIPAPTRRKVYDRWHAVVPPEFLDDLAELVRDHGRWIRVTAPRGPSRARGADERICCVPIEEWDRAMAAPYSITVHLSCAVRVLERAHRWLVDEIEARHTEAAIDRTRRLFLRNPWPFHPYHGRAMRTWGLCEAEWARRFGAESPTFLRCIRRGASRLTHNFLLLDDDQARIFAGRVGDVIERGGE